MLLLSHRAKAAKLLEHRKTRLHLNNSCSHRHLGFGWHQRNKGCQLDLCAQRINKLCRCFLRSVFVPPQIQKYLRSKMQRDRKIQIIKLGRHLQKETDQFIYLFGVQEYLPLCQGMGTTYEIMKVMSHQFTSNLSCSTSQQLQQS